MMIAAPVTVTAPADPTPSNCLSFSKDADGRRLFVDALLAEAKVWPLRVLEPGDEFLPASMPDRFKPQMVVVDAELDQNGRVSVCNVHKQSSFEVLNTASCDLVRAHYVAMQPIQRSKQKIAIDWTSRTTDPQRRACGQNGGTIPVTSSLWITSAVFKGIKSQDGTAFIALDVGTKGQADRCVVLAADVPEDLQRSVCKMAVQRATIMPAVDKDGTLVPARLKLAVRFNK